MTEQARTGSRHDRPSVEHALGARWGLFFARIVLGLMFFQAGLWRVFGIGPIGHARRFFVEPYAETFLPTWSLWTVGAVVPFVELIAGAFLLLGLFRRSALIAIGGVLLVVTFGHLLAEPLFSITSHILPRLILLVVLLLAPASWDRFSLDEWRRRRRNGRQASSRGPTSD